jgi:hypothetical protein
MIDTDPYPVMTQGTSQGDTVHQWERQKRRSTVTCLLADLGWDTGIPGFLGNAWPHDFKLLRRTGVDWRTA